MAQQLPNISLSTTIGVVNNARVDATIAAFSADIAIGERNRDGIGGWWVQYVNAHLAHRAALEAERLARLAEREKHAVEGDGFAVMASPTASGVAFHDPDAADAEFIAALLPWLKAA
jgi:hypothetical protein